MRVAVSQGWMLCMAARVTGCSCCVMKVQRASPDVAVARDAAGRSRSVSSHESGAPSASEHRRGLLNGHRFYGRRGA